MSALIGRLAGLAPPARAPVKFMDRIARTQRRRLDDAVEDVFNQACLTGDLDIAGNLLDVLEKMRARRQANHGRERRLNDDAIVRARREFNRRRSSLPSARAR
jgi:hypothetical protein